MSKDLITIAGPISGKSQFLVYEAEDGQIKIDVRLEDETVWLTQQLMTDLFQTTKQNIGQHLKNIFLEGELIEDSVVKKFFTTAADGIKAMKCASLTAPVMKSKNPDFQPVKRRFLPSRYSGAWRKRAN